VLVARQNGKTFLLVVLALFWLFVQQRKLVLGTSTNLDYAQESWEKAVELCDPTLDSAIDELAELVPTANGVRRTNGQNTLRTLDGCRYKIATASRRGGRSLTVWNLILDELREHHDWSSWSAATKAMNAVSDAQAWAISNAGDDSSVVLNDLLATGRAGSNPRLGLFEWSVPDDTQCTCGGKPHDDSCMLWDQRLWAMANPSMGYRIDADVIASDLNTDPVEVFLAEDLCKRVEALEPPPITVADFDQCAAVDSEPVGPIVLSVAVSIGGAAASIGLAGQRDDGMPHVELIENASGTDWLVDRLKDLKSRWELRTIKRGDDERPAILLDPVGPAGAVLTKLQKAGIDPVLVNGTSKGQSCGQMQIAVRDHAIRILTAPDDRLHVALKAAAKRNLGDGAWAWGRRKSGADVSPLEAITEAAWGLSVAEAAPVQQFFGGWR